MWDRDTLKRLIDDGLVAAWERQCANINGSALYRHDGLVVALVETRTPTLNTVLVEAEPADPVRAIEAAEALCAAHGASLGVDIPAATYPSLEAAMTDAGLRRLDRPAEQRHAFRANHLDRCMVVKGDGDPNRYAVPSTSSTLRPAGRRSCSLRTTPRR